MFHSLGVCFTISSHCIQLKLRIHLKFFKFLLFRVKKYTESSTPKKKKNNVMSQNKSHGTFKTFNSILTEIFKLGISFCGLLINLHQC